MTLLKNDPKMQSRSSVHGGRGCGLVTRSVMEADTDLVVRCDSSGGWFGVLRMYLPVVASALLRAQWVGRAGPHVAHVNSGLLAAQRVPPYAMFLLSVHLPRTIKTAV